MLARKTVKAKVMDEANCGKLSMLEKEFSNFQNALRREKCELYSATEQQAERLLKRIRGQNGDNLRRREYPMILRNDVYDIKVTDNKLSGYWIKIPVYGGQMRNKASN